MSDRPQIPDPAPAPHGPRALVARLLVAFRSAVAGEPGGGAAGTATRRLLLPLARAYAALLRLCSTRDVFLPTAAFPWAGELEANWTAIRDELDAVRGGPELPALIDLIPGERYVADRRWRMFMLRYYGRSITANAARCPRTEALLARVPGLLSANFSVLRPGARITAHHGIFGGLLRYHLGLRVPARAEGCGIRVAGETRHWREGGSLLFDDTRLHEAWNDTDEDRVVLLLDVVRPLPIPLRWLNDAMVRLLARVVMPGLVRAEHAVPVAPRGASAGAAS
jgi:beta-hydroxylase